MIRPDPVNLRECLKAMPIPTDTGGPVFSEPWEAQVFAMAVHLSEAGYFTWEEWVSFFSEELANAASHTEPDDGANYYQHWLATLERLVTAKGLTDPATLHTRKHEWLHAYMNTPHGQPVELNRKLPK